MTRGLVRRTRRLDPLPPATSGLFFHRLHNPSMDLSWHTCPPAPRGFCRPSPGLLGVSFGSGSSHDDEATRERAGNPFLHKPAFTNKAHLPNLSLNGNLRNNGAQVSTRLLICAQMAI